MKNKWRFFAVTLAVVLCMTVFSVTAYAGGGDMSIRQWATRPWKANCNYTAGEYEYR